MDSAVIEEKPVSKQAASGHQQAAMPNLFLIGSAKCGTTSLHSYLNEHPQICGASEKEPSYFADQDELREWLLMESLRPESHDLEAYLGLFGPQGARARYRLESSPTYSSYPFFSGVPERIAAASPDARIIYSLRNPVDRTISLYWQHRKTLKEKRSMREALTPDSIYLTSSDYEFQIERYTKYFDDIIFVDSSRLGSQAQLVLNEIFNALGLEEYELGQEALRRKNETPATTRMARFSLLLNLRDTKTWNRIRAVLPKSSLEFIRKLAVRNVPRDTEGEDEIRQMLTEHFRPQVARFDQRFGTDFEASWF